MGTDRSAKSGRLTALVTALFVTTAVNAETYLCKDTASVAIDQFAVSTSAEEVSEFEQREWVIDTERGWRRADFPHFSGSCQSNKGYVVCRSQDFAFGEAIFSLHPDGTNFVLVYIDYGLDALAFAGTCRRVDAVQNES